MADVGQPLLQLGHTLVHRVLNIIDLRLSDPPGVFDFCLGFSRGISQRTPELCNLFFGRASYLVGMSLSGLPYLDDLCLSFLAYLDCGGFGRVRDRSVTLFGRCPKQFLREGAEIRFDMTTCARESTVDRLADLIVERHSRIIRR
jgi:hypothetical protein